LNSFSRLRLFKTNNDDYDPDIGRYNIIDILSYHYITFFKDSDIFISFLPALVRTYNAGLSFALLFFLGRTHCSNFCIIVQFHHAFSSLARQPCLEALLQPRPGSLARQPCPAALPGSLARQPCPSALPGSLDRQPCPAALPGSLARQFDQFRPDLMRALASSAVNALYFTTVAGHLTACARCCCPDRFKLVFSPISPCFHYLHALRALLSSRQVQTCSVVLR
jgi:hypothetical protein